MRIDSETKRRQAERVRKEFTKGLSKLGFARSGTTFWIREREHIVQGIHIHLFTFDTTFRVHLFIHVKGVKDEQGLNGISSYDGWYSASRGWLRKPRKYVFRFNRMDASVAKCASELLAYCQDIAEPWFSDNCDLARLLKDKDSPLSEDGKRALQPRLDD